MVEIRAGNITRRSLAMMVKLERLVSPDAQERRLGDLEGIKLVFIGSM